MGWFRRLRGSLSGDRLDEAFDQEARFHLEQRIDEYVARGMSSEDAKREAIRRFGNVTLARERTRDADSYSWVRDAGHDLRYGLRQLRRTPAHTTVSVLILAIGIGANTALFSVVDALLLRQLPVDAPEQLVLFNWLEGRRNMRTGMDGVRTTDAETGRSTSTSFSYPTFLQLKQANQALVELFAFKGIQQLNTVVDDSAEIATGQYVSGNYYRGLGVGAILGRTIGDDDDRAGAAPVATITHRYWQRRFDSDPAIVGRTLVVNRTAFTIVGVTPPEFAGVLEVTQSADITVAFAVEPLFEGADSDLNRPAFLWVQVMGRLKPGVSHAQAAVSLNGVMQRAMLGEWQQSIAQSGQGSGVDSTRTLEDAPILRGTAGGQGLMDSRRRYAQPLLLLMGSGALVLLVTCMNLANLLLSRGAARHREIATRLALGASRGRLVRQLLTESLLLAIIGSTIGLAVAFWGQTILLVWTPFDGPLQFDAALSWRTLGFSGAMALFTCVLFGLVPALRVTRTQVSQTTKRAVGGVSLLARSLVVGQIAASLILLVAAALFVGTLRNLRSVDAGFNADRLLLFRIQPQLNGYQSTQLESLYARMIARIESVPGVRSATLSRHPLLSFSRRADGVIVEGSVIGSSGAEINIVASGFFRTMEIPVILGRGFTERETGGAPRVAVVNELFATTHFPAGNPLGRRFWFGDVKDGDAIEIVGVTRDAKYTDLRNPTRPTVYVPLAQDVPGQANFAVRTAGEPLALAPAVRQALRDIDATLPLFAMKSQAAQAEESMAKEASFARLSTVFGSIALLLVAAGLFGTMSYAVVRRTSEIGVRMALGAGRAAVIRMILRDALLMSVAGIVVGIPAALAAGHALRAVLNEVLFGLEPTNPVAIAGATAALILTALVAAFLPARAAARVDPIVALQSE
ncbi:MAG: ADOP family duplicated permease [Vicinamibacterales bacterium]